MYVALLATLLAQLTATAPPAATPPPAATIAPASTPAPADTAAPVAPAPPQSPGRRYFNDPRRIPNEMPPASAEDVMIRNSGSTNFAGYAFIVHPDASVDIFNGGQTDHKTIAMPQAHWLFALVKADVPFDQMGAARCMKSASFGSSTTVTYQNHVTPDLSCGGGTESRELMRTIGVILGQLQIDIHRNRMGGGML